MCGFLSFANRDGKERRGKTMEFITPSSNRGRLVPFHWLGQLFIFGAKMPSSPLSMRGDYREIHYFADQGQTA